MKTLVNLTPHAVTVGGVAFPPSGDVARVAVTRQWLGDVPMADGRKVAAYRPVLGAVTGLPPAQKGVILVVSAMVRSHPDVAKRKDVASPGNLVRDDNGVVVGCDGLDFN